jgi:hypothetical protein
MQISKEKLPEKRPVLSMPSSHSIYSVERREVLKLKVAKDPVYFKRPKVVNN